MGFICDPGLLSVNNTNLYQTAPRRQLNRAGERPPASGATGPAGVRAAADPLGQRATPDEAA